MPFISRFTFTSKFRNPRPRPDSAFRRRALVAAIEAMEDRIVLSTLIVTDPGDSGPNTLRQAILDANLDSTPDVINFNIGGGGHQVITLASPLPTITNTITINGSSQPRVDTATTPLIEIDGNSLSSPNGLIHLTGANSVVKGLVINNVDGVAIWPECVNFAIQGCYIGTDVTGAIAKQSTGTGHRGILTEHGSGLIGGTAAGEGNLISGFNGAGIDIYDNSPVTIQGNFIGTNATGTGAIGNQIGIFGEIQATAAMIIGGTVSGAGNLISGNTLNGVRGSGLVVQGNKIGTDVTGTAAIPNVVGIYGDHMTVGGTALGASNLISGNSNQGVALFNSTIQGNFIGTDVTGTHALGNETGVSINDSLLGGPSAAARNIISGNLDIGVDDRGGNTIQGNFIGTDVTGEIGLGGNSQSGIDGNYSSGNSVVIGNVISSAGIGVAVRSPFNTLFQGNKIGSNKDGTHAIGNHIGFFLPSDHPNNNIIGGTNPGEGNLISGNGAGIYITNSGRSTVAVMNNIIQGNLIGTDINGGASDFTNYQNIGIYLESGVAGNIIGGTTPNSGNVIANNNNGVVILSANPTDPYAYGNSILGNSIRDNSSQGITLLNNAVVPANDPGDTDTGPNDLQNFPVLTTVGAGASTTANGTFNSTPNSTFRLEFFANAVRDQFGYSQGGRYLGFVAVTTDDSGDATFSASNLGTSGVGEFITATATASNGSTSEFSIAVEAVILNHAPMAIPTGPSLAVPGQPLTYTLAATDPDSGDLAVGFTYNVNFGDGSPAQTIAATANNGTGVPLTHVFSANGNYTITLTATDSYGAVSPSVTLAVTVQTAALMPDPLHPGQTLLAIGGTTGDDTIKIKDGEDCGEVKVVLRDDSHVVFYRHTFDPAINRIAVYGGTGNDNITVDSDIKIPAWLYGGDGNDRLKGGGGTSVLLGGAGDDLLVGAGGRDILIGGTGADKIVGDSGDDILISGYTAYDANEAALATVLAEWTSNRSYADRVRNLRGDAASPSFAARANGNLFFAVDGTYGRSVTVFDDGAADILTGGGGLDWFLFNADGDNAARKDKVTDLSAREFVDDLDFING